MESWVANARYESGLSPEDCASAMGCSRATYLSRENNPGNLTLNEIRVLNNVFNAKSKKILWGALSEFRP